VGINPGYGVKSKRKSKKLTEPWAPSYPIRRSKKGIQKNVLKKAKGKTNLPGTQEGYSRKVGGLWHIRAKEN